MCALVWAEQIHHCDANESFFTVRCQTHVGTNNSPFRTPDAANLRLCYRRHWFRSFPAGWLYIFLG